MVPPKRASKRFAGSIEEDNGVTTPKKDKMTPAKKNPKVVQLPNSGVLPKSPVSPAARSPAVSAKKGPKKTPAKTPNVNTPGKIVTPKSGKLSEPSPLQTRSARKKKAELNSTIGTPMSKGVTPSGKKLNIPAVGTPKVQTPVSNSKVKKEIKVEEEDEDDLDLALDDDVDDSDDVDSDDDLDEDSDDAESDEGMESEDEIEAEKRKAELEAILNKPGNRKSILKKVDSPAVKTPNPQFLVKTPAKESAIKQVEPSPSVKVEELKKGATPAKSPTTVNSPKIETPKKSKASDFFVVEAENDNSMTPNKRVKGNQENTSEKSTKTPIKKDLQNQPPLAKVATPNKTPVQKVATPNKTPVQKVATPSKTPVQTVATPSKTPVQKVAAPNKTPSKEARTPIAKASEEKAGVPVESTVAATNEVASESAAPIKETVVDSTTSTKVPLTEEQLLNFSEKKKARKAKLAAKRDKKRAEARDRQTESGMSKEVVDESCARNNSIVSIDKGGVEAIKKKLKVDGKTEKEIAVELPVIVKSFIKRLSYVRCLNCRLTGHMLKQCPTYKWVNKCYKCGDTTHAAKACAIKGQVYTYADCFLCKQIGHLTKNCPKNEKGVFPRGGSCHRCREVTHLVKDCPQRNGLFPKLDENAPETTVEKGTVSIGLLNGKQSADADVELHTPSKIRKFNGKKKQVVKF